MIKFKLILLSKKELMGARPGKQPDAAQVRNCSSNCLFFAVPCAVPGCSRQSGTVTMRFRATTGLSRKSQF